MKQYSQSNIQPIWDWYDNEKEYYALSSPKRPKKENTITLCFRQTTFPSMLRNPK